MRYRAETLNPTLTTHLPQFPRRNLHVSMGARMRRVCCDVEVLLHTLWVHSFIVQTPHDTPKGCCDAGGKGGQPVQIWPRIQLYPGVRGGQPGQSNSEGKQWAGINGGVWLNISVGGDYAVGKP